MSLAIYTCCACAELFACYSRDLPSYHLRLPAKRIFSQQQSVEFVEERRQQLNGYLQSLLAIPPVASAAPFVKSHMKFIYC